MTDGIAEEPEGLPRIGHWLTNVFAGGPILDIWVALDDRLRLSLAQGWVLHRTGRADDDLAEDLAADDSDNADFETMLTALITHWKSVYADLRDGFEVVDRIDLIGADMELLVLTGPEHAGRYPDGGQVPDHSFINRLESDEWLIAALGRRLPVPGWPPSEEVVPGLFVDG